MAATITWTIDNTSSSDYNSYAVQRISRNLGIATGTATVSGTGSTASATAVAAYFYSPNSATSGLISIQMGEPVAVSGAPGSEIVTKVAYADGGTASANFCSGTVDFIAIGRIRSPE